MDGQTLESIAKTYFGSEIFWVYIFDVNRDKLNSPKESIQGMKLYLPNPEFYGINSGSESSISAAMKRADEINKEVQ